MQWKYPPKYFHAASCVYKAKLVGSVIIEYMIVDMYVFNNLTKKDRVQSMVLVWDGNLKFDAHVAISFIWSVFP